VRACTDRLAGGPGSRLKRLPCHAVSALGDRRPVARAGAQLVLANVRYWTTVAPIVRAQLKHWERRAGAIGNADLRALALEKLHSERFNAEAGAMLATLAGRAQREDVVRAIVAIEVLFDLLDGLTERPLRAPLRDGERLFSAFTGAFAASSEPPIEGCPEIGGYLQELSGAVRDAVARLPAAWAVSEAARACAARAAQAQIRMHAVGRLGTTQLRQWAQEESQGSGLDWREFLAGSASAVLVLHALIAAAADHRTTADDAEQIATVYLSICVVLTLLDSLIDHEQDTRSGEAGYIGLWEEREQLTQSVAGAALRAARGAPELPDGPHHLMVLTGVVAYYASAPGAGSDLARPVVAELQRNLSLISPTLAVMRVWRLCKRARPRRG
jgi:tetraprenyl-beta-curcumene synthase